MRRPVKDQREMGMSYDNKRKEDEWFARHEKDLIKNIRRDREHRHKELEKAHHQKQAQERKELHWMKCPKCGSDMTEKVIEAVHVDECTLCHGIFLDRDETEQWIIKQRREPTSFMKKLLGLGK